MNFLSTVIGKELTAVHFIQTYIQFQFDDEFLTLFEWPDYIAVENHISFGEEGYRDAICNLIGKKVFSAKVEIDTELEIIFEEGAKLRRSLIVASLRYGEGETGNFFSEMDSRRMVVF